MQLLNVAKIKLKWQILKLKSLSDKWKLAFHISFSIRDRTQFLRRFQILKSVGIPRFLKFTL